MGQGHDHGTDNMNDGRLATAVAVNVLLTLAQIIAWGQLDDKSALAFRARTRLGRKMGEGRAVLRH